MSKHLYSKDCKNAHELMNQILNLGRIRVSFENQDLGLFVITGKLTDNPFQQMLSNKALCGKRLLKCNFTSVVKARKVLQNLSVTH